MTTDTNPATVLIVEDEQPLADLFAAFLRPTYTVHTVYDGRAALETMNDEIDVVLLDRRMPGLSGEEVLEAIHESGYDCRVAMVTAVTPDVDVIEMGFDDYLTKPVDRTELRETVDRLVELAAYDELMREYYQLVSKRAKLEAENPNADFTEYEGFVRLEARLDELEAELQSTEETVSEVDIRTLLDRPGSRSDEEQR